MIAGDMEHVAEWQVRQVEEEHGNGGSHSHAHLSLSLSLSLGPPHSATLYPPRHLRLLHPHFPFHAHLLTFLFLVPPFAANFRTEVSNQSTHTKYKNGGNGEESQGMVEPEAEGVGKYTSASSYSFSSSSCCLHDTCNCGAAGFERKAVGGKDSGRKTQQRDEMRRWWVLLLWKRMTGGSFLFASFTMFVEEAAEWVDLKIVFLATTSFFCLFCLSGCWAKSKPSIASFFYLVLEKIWDKVGSSVLGCWCRRN